MSFASSMSRLPQTLSEKPLSFEAVTDGCHTAPSVKVMPRHT